MASLHCKCSSHLSVTLPFLHRLLWLKIELDVVLLQVQTSKNLSAEAQKVIQEYYLPWLSIVNNTGVVVLGNPVASSK